MEITDRIGHVKDQVQQHRLEDRLERTQRENVSLRAESDALKEDRRDISKRLTAIERTAGSRPKRHWLRRFATVATVAGGSYMLGAKAGRQRYEDIRAWLDRVTHKGREAAGDLRAQAGDIAEEASVVSSRVSDAGQVIGETVQTIVEGPSAAPDDRSSGMTVNASGEA
jgi:hypothetical protein